MRKTQIQAQWVLSHLSPQRISKGVSIESPVRRGSKTEIKFISVDGTHTPTSRIQKWISHPERLSPKAEKSLSGFYHRFAYRQLRSEGASRSEASRFRNKPPEKVREIVKKYEKYVDIVTRERKRQEREYQKKYPHAPKHIIKREYIVGGFQESDTEFDDWEEYIAATYGTRGGIPTFSSHKDRG